MRRTFPGCAVLVATMLVGLGARADRERVVVVGLGELRSPLSTPLQMALSSSLVGGLEAGGLEVVPEPELARRTERLPGLRSCTTMTCLRSLAQELGVALVVRARVDLVEANNYNIAVELVDAAQERAVGHVEDRCQVCTTAEAKEAVSNAARLLGASRAAAMAKPSQTATATAPASPDGGPHVDKPRARRWKLWLGIGLGAAAVVAGVAVGVAVAQSGGSDFWSRGQKSCTAPGCQLGDFRP